jgi:hypothetical protein
MVVSFKSWRSYHDFQRAVHTKQRYILDDESKNFLNSIIKTCKGRETEVKAGSILWRAQNGHDWKPYYQEDPDTREDIHVDDIPSPFSIERMKPLTGSALEGRANPKGIPCLYVATDKKTAMSEVRPWLGAIISIGQFEIINDLKVLDFSVEHGSKHNLGLYFRKPTNKETLNAVWRDIDNAFSEPTRASDSKSDYAPTQIISEFIKSKGYDGIAYKSSLAEGHNLALFNLESAKVVGRSVYKTSSIKFEFEPVEEN